jgi:hypothetical protein
MIQELRVADGAQKIVDLRMSRAKPALWTLVSFIGKVELDDGFMVHGRPECVEYDWRWSVGLDVVVFARAGQVIAHHLKAMKNERPKNLSIWDVDKRIGSEVMFTYPNPSRGESGMREMIRQTQRKTRGIELENWSPGVSRDFARMLELTVNGNPNEDLSTDDVVKLITKALG